eukprot:3681956-Pyramimonas_sp.AAC.1
MRPCAVAQTRKTGGRVREEEVEEEEEDEAVEEEEGGGKNIAFIIDTSLACCLAVRSRSSLTCSFYLLCARRHYGVHQRCVARGCCGVYRRCGVHKRC